MFCSSVFKAAKDRLVVAGDAYGQRTRGSKATLVVRRGRIQGRQGQIVGRQTAVDGRGRRTRVVKSQFVNGSSVFTAKSSGSSPVMPTVNELVALSKANSLMFCSSVFPPS